MSTRPQRIYDVLSRHTMPMTAAEIAADLQDNRDHCSSDLSRMRVLFVDVVGKVQGRGKPENLFKLKPGAVRPGSQRDARNAEGRIVPRVLVPVVRAQPAPVRPRRIVVVDGRPMEVVWPVYDEATS